MLPWMKHTEKGEHRLNVHGSMEESCFHLRRKLDMLVHWCTAKSCELEKSNGPVLNTQPIPHLIPKLIFVLSSFWVLA